MSWDADAEFPDIRDVPSDEDDKEYYLRQQRADSDDEHISGGLSDDNIADDLEIPEAEIKEVREATRRRRKKATQGPKESAHVPSVPATWLPDITLLLQQYIGHLARRYDATAEGGAQTPDPNVARRAVHFRAVQQQMQLLALTSIAPEPLRGVAEPLAPRRYQTVATPCYLPEFDALDCVLKEDLIGLKQATCTMPIPLSHDWPLIALLERRVGPHWADIKRDYFPAAEDRGPADLAGVALDIHKAHRLLSSAAPLDVEIVKAFRHLIQQGDIFVNLGVRVMIRSVRHGSGLKAILRAMRDNGVDADDATVAKRFIAAGSMVNVFRACWSDRIV